MMTTVKYQEQILDAIDQLRHRKARPDAERIYNCLFRRHSINCNDAKLALERCVESGVVLRVAYKGNISYRNAAKKFSHLKRDAQGEIIRMPGKPRRKFTALLTNAFTELILHEPDYLELGVPPHELIKTVLSKDSVRYTKRYVSILLEKEVEAGGLIRMASGNFLVGPNKTDRCQLDGGGGGGEVVENDGNNESNLNTLNKTYKKKAVAKTAYRKDPYMESLRNEERRNENLRVGGRRKRAKKVFDPSDNNLPKKRGRPVGSQNRNVIDKQSGRPSDSDSRPESRTSQNSRDQQGGVCSVCHVQNKKGPNVRMVSCRECSNKAHESCLNGEDMMLKTYPDNTWQCPHCKTCIVCYETSDAGQLIVCAICADGYHMTCHTPKVTERVKPGSKWLCFNCQMPEQLAVDHIQIGYNMENNLANMHDDKMDGKSSSSPDISRNTTPTNFISSPSSPTPPTLSPQTTQNGRRMSPSESDSKSDCCLSIKEEDIILEEHVDSSIPDATNWSPDDVYQYFAQYFPEEASVFKEQEIDGHSLLLMKRMDVLKGLELKLGPALKIYRHVLKLQYRRDDPKLYWV